MRKIKHIIGLFSALILLAVSTSCIDDTTADCALNVRFQYVYNMNNADAFANEVDKVELFVFDSQKKLVASYVADGIYGNDNFTMTLPLPGEIGEYTFVAWAYETTNNQEHSYFDITKVDVGDPIENTTARLKRNARSTDNSSRINNTLNGVKTQRVSGAQNEVLISMMKVTNDVRVILMPVNGEQRLYSENYDIKIDHETGWLAHDATPLREDWITCRPYYQATEKDPDSQENTTTEIDHAVVADMNTSRIMYTKNPRLTIYDTNANKEVLSVNLAWLLALQYTSEHKNQWAEQEYLDRQSDYSLTFFIDGDTWLSSKVIINGWTLNLGTTELE
jgi:hypothetical protein